MFHKILVGVDGSEAGRRALERALDLSAHFKARTLVVSVEENLPAYAATVGEVQDEEGYEHAYFSEVQREVRRLAEARGLHAEMEVVPGHAAAALTRLAVERECDLIVVGHTGHSRLHHLFLGSTADRVVERAHCAVLVVR
jgi:nucleotide-binding universal stress UspA family protein